MIQLICEFVTFRERSIKLHGFTILPKSEKIYFQVDVTFSSISWLKKQLGIQYKKNGIYMDEAWSNCPKFLLWALSWLRNSKQTKWVQFIWTPCICFYGVQEKYINNVLVLFSASFVLK